MWYHSYMCVHHVNFLCDMHHSCGLLIVTCFPGGSEVKASASNEGDLGLIPGSGRSLGEGNGTPLQYSCLENPMDGGAWRATVHGGCKESDMTERLHFHFSCSSSVAQLCLTLCNPMKQ